MTHPYPRHRSNLPYTGKHHYFLTFCTQQRRRAFTDPEVVHLVYAQFLRAAGHSDCKAFIKAAKQYSRYAFGQRHEFRLWQRYSFERVIRDDTELALTIRYMVSNPVRAGLAKHPLEYPHLGSQIHSVAELLEMCEYRAESADLPPEGGSHGAPIASP